MNIVKEKIEQAVDLLNELDLDLWLTFVRESANNPDPVLDIIYGTSCTWPSAFLIHRSGETAALVGSLDVANTEEVGAYQTVKGYVGGISDELLKWLKKFDPQSMAINYSVNSVMADGLSHGMWLMLREILKGSHWSERIVSAEQIISALRGRKSEEELRRITAACDVAQEIIHTVTDFLKPGVTEKQVADFVRAQVVERGIGLAWDPLHCPAVFSGPDTAGAHAGPTERAVEPGHIVNIDFGVKIDDYCSDLQRTWYVRKPGEDVAPETVMRGFNTIVESIQKAADFIKPGIEGHEADTVARQHIVDAGYEEYPHALGHQVGRVAHDGGGLLAPKWERYGNLPFIPLETGNVFTIEPRLTVEGHGIATVEEEIVVTEDGFRYLSKPQTEIYLV